MTRNSHPVNPDFQQSSDILISLAPNTTFESAVSVSPSYQHTLASRGGHKLLQPRPYRGKFSVWAVVSILSLVTVLAVLAVCRTSQRRLDSGGAERRRLSDSEDEQERSEIVEQCLDLEQELGLQPAVVEHVEEASEAKSRLVGMLYDSAMGFEYMNFLASQRLQDEAHSPPSKIPRLNESRPSTSHPQASVAALLRRPSRLAVGDTGDALDADAWLESEVVVGEVEHQRHATENNGVSQLQRGASATAVRPSTFYGADDAARPSPSFLVSRAYSTEYAVTPDAWLDGSSAPMDEHTFHQAGVGSASQHPDVDSAFPAPTSAYFVGKFVHHAGRVYHWTAPAGVGQAIAMPSTKVKAVQQRWHADEAVRTALEGVESSAATVGQGTSSGVGESSDTGNIHLHPFVRLPVVNPKDVRRSFRDEFALSFDLSINSPMESYMTMRSLFAKASLTAEDVEKLMAEAELLASYAAQKLAVPCSICKAGNVFMKLSSLFMMFDYLVCTIEILGEKMNTGRWWREFAEKFQTEYSLTVNTTKERTVALTKLVNRLSSALSIYKEGRRPPLSDIIQLKREIITQAYRNSQLSNSLWKLWLQDDEDFSSSSGDIERPPGSEKQGQR